MPKHNLALDATLLTSLMACPRMTNWRFNESLTPIGGKSNSLETGSLAHVIIEFYNKALMQGKARNEAIAIGYAAGYEYLVPYKPDNLYVRDTEHLGLEQTPEESGNYDGKELIGWKYVFETMEQYFHYWRNYQSTVLASEEVRGKIIYEDDDMRIIWKAKFDEIDDTNTGLVSMDHKTMSQNRTTISMNNQFMGQCFILGSRTVIVNKIGWQKSLPPEKKFIRPGINYTADRLAEFANETVPFYSRLLIAYSEGNYWPPQHTSCEGKYGPCNFLNICETDRANREDALKTYFKKGKVWDISND